MYRSSEDVETSQASYVKHVLYYVKDMAKQQASKTLCFPHSMLSRVVLQAGIPACRRIPGFLAPRLNSAATDGNFRGVSSVQVETLMPGPGTKFCVGRDFQSFSVLSPCLWHNVLS